jgi:uncharacterized protein YebE (UPF0316 family)
MGLDTLWEMVSTAGLAVSGVTLWTFRVAVTARGSRALGSLLAATEAMLFVVAFSRLMGSFDSPHLVIAYGAGVAAGTMLGLALDSRLNPQLARVDIFDSTGEAIGAVARSGYAFTLSDGVGSRGQVSVASLVVSEPRVEEILDAVRAEGTDAFWTVAPIRRASVGRAVAAHRHPFGGRGGLTGAQDRRSSGWIGTRHQKVAAPSRRAGQEGLRVHREAV